jgi:hypothetical protein
MQEVENHCKSFRDWRNRRGAHRDLDTALNRHARPLPPASRQMIEDALQRISDLMNALLGYFANGAQKYFYGLDPLGNGDDLIACLQHPRARRANDQRQ